MPNYDFDCCNCGLTFEMQVPSHVQEMPCPSCIKGIGLRKPSAPGFILKGEWPGKSLKKGERREE